jgi:DNA-binding transcriptional ArsR family regulator
LKRPRKQVIIQEVASPLANRIDSGTRARIRQRSKRLFGNADRLEVALAVAESSGLVHAQELADQLGISPPRVRAQLLAFVAAGIMRVMPRSGLVQNYERIDDPFWSLVSVLVPSLR